MPDAGSIANFSNPAAYLAAIVESSDDAIISKSLDGMITSWNSGAERIFGYTPGEAIGKPITMIIPPDRQNEEVEIIGKLKKGQRIDHFETVRVTKEGREIQLSVTISPIRDDEGNIVGASKVARDITQKKALEEKLRRTNRDLEDIAHIASHDLKEPLRGLIMKASFLLEDYADKLDEDGREELKGLVELSRRSYHLINDLLNVSRAGRQETVVQDVDTAAVVAHIKTLLDERLRERDARITVSGPLPRFRGDRNALTEILSNLITNAIVYNDKPEPLAEVGFLKEKPNGPKVAKNVFYVKDNGIGIDRRLHDEIFRMFKRLVISKKYNESGSGIGLTLVKKLVERCGGRVWLESEPGAGSTFYFTIGECSSLPEDGEPADSRPNGNGSLTADGIPKNKEGGDEQDTADAVVRPGPNARPYQESTDVSGHSGT